MMQAACPNYAQNYLVVLDKSILLLLHPGTAQLRASPRSEKRVFGWCSRGEGAGRFSSARTGPLAVNPAFSGVSRVRNGRGGASSRRLRLDLDTPTSSRRDVTNQKPMSRELAGCVYSFKMPMLPAGPCSYSSSLGNDIFKTDIG